MTERACHHFAYCWGEASTILTQHQCRIRNCANGAWNVKNWLSVRRHSQKLVVLPFSHLHSSAVCCNGISAGVRCIRSSHEIKLGNRLHGPRFGQASSTVSLERFLQTTWPNACQMKYGGDQTSPKSLNTFCYPRSFGILDRRLTVWHLRNFQPQKPLGATLTAGL